MEQTKFPFFSIVIPVYNGLSHDLPICLESIWKQPLDKSLYEVICVDDCSTDNTRKWLREQQKLHSNLVLIENEENIRQGGGRNRGVKKAQGKYIMFIDQDDYYHQGSFGRLYEHLSIQADLDVLVSDSAYQFRGHESNKMQLNLPFKDVCDGIKFIQKNGSVLAPWRMAIKRDFYERNKILFPERCQIEDVDWACTVLYYSKKMQYVPILLVHYNKDETGQTDNMYRNMNILRANTIAGTRTLQVAESLYENTPVQAVIKGVAESYYNFSCRYLFGMFKPIKEKREIINLIEISHSKYRLVEYALKNPIFFCAITNIGVIPFRILRAIRRWLKARQLEG